MPKTVRFGFAIRTTTGAVITTDEHTTQASDDKTAEQIHEELMIYFAKEHLSGPWVDLGMAQSTHSGLAGWSYTLVAAAQIESVSVWVELEPKHAATPVAPVDWDPGVQPSDPQEEWSAEQAA